MRKIILSSLLVGLPTIAMAAGTGASVTTSITSTGNGGASLSAALAGVGGQSSSSSGYNMSSSLGAASTLTGTVSPDGKFSGSGHTTSFSNVNGHITVQNFGWTTP